MRKIIFSFLLLMVFFLLSQNVEAAIVQKNRNKISPVIKIEEPLFNDNLFPTNSTTVIRIEGITDPRVPFFASVELQQLNNKGKVIKNWGILDDKNKNGESTPGDGIYTKTIELKEKKDGLVYFRFRAKAKSGYVYSKQGIIEFTSFKFPSDIAESSVSVVTTTPLGELVVGDELLIDFKDGVRFTKIKKIVENAGGKIVGKMTLLSRYQVKFLNIDDNKKIEKIIEKLKSTKDVEFVFYNSLVNLID